MKSFEEVLDARAQRLARSHDSAGTNITIQSHLSFEWVGQRFAIAVSALVEVIGAPAIAPLPSGPAGLAGVFGVRGVIRPAIDLSRLQGGAGSATPDAKFVILFRCGEREAGLLADQVTALGSLSALGQAVLDGPGWRLRPVIEGIGADGHIVLNTDALYKYIFPEVHA